MTLFPLDKPYPQGFSYFPDFLTETEERDLLSFIATLNLHTFLFQGYEAKRRVKSFGYDYSFEKRTLSKGDVIPAEFHPLLKKVARQLHIPAEDFAEVLVTEYPKGSVINWHRDAPPFDLIAGISLSADCIFKLRPHDEAKRSRRSVVSVPVQHRSLYVLKDQVRTEWQHSTAPVSTVRWSITLRTLR